MTNAVPCLDPETIAAYLDRRLDPAERTRVEEHLADCEECRTLLSETAAFLEADAAAKPAPVALRPRAARRTWIWSMAAAAATLLALTPLVLQRMRPTPESALAELDRALAGKRYVESRLSGFEYGAFVSATRGPATRLEDLPLSAIAAAGKVEELTGASDTPESLASLGASQLAIGRVDKAVENLEDAARIAPKNARIQSDLAAAYLARFRAGDSPEDPAKAVEAAATAVALDPQSRAAAFNRALALEALPLRGEALRAWEAYLALDPSSGWANEARAHIEELKRPLPPPPPSPSAMLDELESVVFPAWGRAVLTGRTSEAHDALDRARALATEIHGLDEDRLAIDTIGAIDAASRGRVASLARAHVLAGDGRKAYLDGRYADADRAFEAAYDLLRGSRSPYADWVSMRRSTSRFQIGDVAGSRSALRLPSPGSDAVSPTLLAREKRMRGLLNARAGRLTESLAQYQQALSHLRDDDAGTDARAMLLLISEDLALLGERAEAWRHRRQALLGVARASDARQQGIRLLELAIHSLREERPLLALHLVDAALAAVGGAPLRTVAECLIHRARIIASLGWHADGDEAIQRAAAAVETAESGGKLPRLRAELMAARAELSASQRRERSDTQLSEAYDTFTHDGQVWRLPGILFARGQTRASLGRLDAAEADFQGAMNLLERQRSSISSDALRVSFSALARDLMQERMELARRRGVLADELFAMSDAAKARVLREGLAPESAGVSIDDIRRNLPAGTAVVSYAVIADRLLLWRVSSERWTAWAEDIGAADLKVLVMALHRAVRARQLTSDSQERLFDLLVRRALEDSDDVSTLILVPDDCLYDVPFGALVDSRDGQYLVQKIQVVVSPNASLLLNARGRTPPKRHILIAAATAPAGPLSLPPLHFARTEARAIASLYPSHQVLFAEGATATAFLRSASTSRVVHFAGHARVNRQAPSLSRLILTAEDGSPGSEALLSDRIASHSFPSTELVVLGACSTGVGLTVFGEGSLSLARSFLMAGVGSVIASMWDLEDRAAHVELYELHRLLAQGEPAAKALRAAQLAMITHADVSLHAPIAWAGLSMFVAGALES